jgi:polyisoprenoid-binding protein YceI
MRHSGRLAMLMGVLAAAMILGGGYLLLSARGSGAPPPVALSADGGTGGGGTGGGGSSSGGHNGSWHVTPGDSTFVGYRIKTQLLAAQSPEEAVGRSGAVSGGMRIAGGRVEAVHIDADLRELGSDQPLRDKTLRQLGLETDRYPMAVFDLTEPIAFRAPPEEGQVLRVQARGNLKVHGTTRPVTLTLQARWKGDLIELGGQMPVRLADYRIAPPLNGAVMAVDDKGTIEVSLDFARDDA